MPMMHGTTTTSGPASYQVHQSTGYTSTGAMSGGAYGGAYGSYPTSTTGGYPTTSTGGYPTTSTGAYTSNVAYSPSGRRSSGVALPPNSSVQSERLLNSTVLREEFLGQAPQQDQIRYVEVPVIEEVIRHVPRREVVEVERRVPRVEVEFVERIVEVPQIQYVDRQVEVPQVQEVVRHVPVRQVVDVPREVVKYVPKVETKIVEKEVEVAGEVIEIPKPYTVENRITVPRYVDQSMTCVVAQSLHPVISESETDYVDVEMREYNPYLVPVNVVIPRPVARQLLAQKKREEHRLVDIPVGHFNAILKSVNANLSDAELEGKLISVGGVIPIATGVKFATLTTTD
eukprot:Blabericola_migrator_1__12809@NODE_825_length_6370_cov_320_094241_g582_i0_p3_GENE_NODE_825_length_6370_cov_320_094241_g582_i0NODE_825_length_6370_cov_320_094241_g582_i0_p3_ORF_typecomplete_len343_score57_61IMCp/PF12314_8/0_015IMCp/PF12314_8/5_4e12IMCp/PF12314_8/25IMCp/PF12314_8/1_2e03DUF1380/PF07128_12/1_7e02DUF1380/PF07128_12/7_2_NODE_825_length_6370_cov_320_094241_g582_i038934921